MFQNILIPVDGSPCSERAAHLGLEFVRRLGGRVIFTHALIEHVSEDDGQRVLGPSKTLAEKAGVKFETRLLDGYTQGIGDAIVHECQDSGCDLIVMGTHGREGLEHLLLGSVAERVSRQALVPVMLVRSLKHPTKDIQQIERIVVTVDGSLPSLLALTTANELACALGASLEVLHVIPAVPSGYAYAAYEYAPIIDYDRYQRDLETESQAIVAAALAHLKANATKMAEVSTSRVPANGQRVGDVIAHAATEHHADLIVMSTHGRTGFDRLLLGSVAERVSHRADVPVLFVRAPQVKVDQPETTGSSAAMSSVAATPTG
jgi:nucleotide-binding universal stress UspA family protein